MSGDCCWEPHYKFYTCDSLLKNYDQIFVSLAAQINIGKIKLIATMHGVVISLV